MSSIRELRHDRTKEVATEAVHWTQTHRTTIIVTLGGALLLAAIILGAYGYLQKQNQAASAALGHAMHVLNSPVRQPGQPEDPNQLTFGSPQERDKTAIGEFEGVAAKFPRTDAGHYALYMAGVVQLDQGDNSAAEKSFDRANDVNGDVSALANLSLANLYASEKRDADAVKLYKDLIDHPTPSVPKVTTQLQLAQFYEEHNQQPDAMKIYEQMQKDNTKNPLGQLAEQHIAALKAGK